MQLFSARYESEFTATCGAGRFDVSWIIRRKIFGHVTSTLAVTGLAQFVFSLPLPVTFQQLDIFHGSSWTVSLPVGGRPAAAPEF